MIQFLLLSMSGVNVGSQYRDNRTPTALPLSHCPTLVLRNNSRSVSAEYRIVGPSFIAYPCLLLMWINQKRHNNIWYIIYVNIYIWVFSFEHFSEIVHHRILFGTKKLLIYISFSLLQSKYTCFIKYLSRMLVHNWTISVSKDKNWGYVQRVLFICVHKWF